MIGEGVIEAYDVGDALGTIRLDSGDALRFGRSACTFDPVTGDRVRVLEVGVALGKPRAKRVESCGPRELTRSERVVLMRTLLLGPAQNYSDWALACRVAWSTTRPEQAAACAAIRAELLERDGRTSTEVDEMIAIARWANALANPAGAKVATVVGDGDDILFAIDSGERSGVVSAEEAERARRRVCEIG